MTRTRWLRVGLYGSLAFVILLPLAHPYSRQLLIGPKIRDLPLCYWQDSFRHYADPGAGRDSLASQVYEWLGYSRRREIWARPDRAEDMLPVLLSLVDDPQPRVREMVAYQFEQGFPPDKVVPALTHMFDDPEAKVRTAAVCSLALIKPPATSALPRLKLLMDDADARCRVQAAWAVWQISKQKHDRLVPILREALNDANALARMEAAQILGTLGPEAADTLPDVAKLATSDTHAAVRAEAAYALRGFGPPAIPTLLRLLRDTNPTCRQNAVQSLGCNGPAAKEAVPVLVPLMNDETDNVRDAVLDALRRIDPDQFPAPKDKLDP